MPRKYLLPLLLTVSVFFISQGICVPDFSALQQASISRTGAAKPHTVVLVKGHLKSPQSRLSQSAPYCDLCSDVGVIDRPTAIRLPLGREFHAVATLRDCTVPARAPPA